MTLSVSKWGLVAATVLSVTATSGSASPVQGTLPHGGPGGGERYEILHLNGHAEQATVLTGGDPRTGVGNKHLYVNAIQRQGSPYGTEMVDCTQTGGSLTPPGPHSDQCTGTFIFPDGQLTWQNGTSVPSSAAPDDINLVITGGTGRYTRASGHGHVVVATPGNTTQTLFLWLRSGVSG